MRVCHDSSGESGGRTAKGKGAKGRRRSFPLRLGLSVLLFFGMLGGKLWFPQQAEPVLSVVGEALSKRVSLTEVTRALGCAAAGEGEISAVFLTLFTGAEEDSPAAVDHTHGEWELQYLASHREAIPSHVLGAAADRLCWLEQGREAH